MLGWFKKKSTTASQTYPDPSAWSHAHPRQRERAARSLAELRGRQVPAYPGPLLVEDDDEAVIRSAQDVARRVMVLWAVDMKAEGVDRKRATRHLKNLGLNAAVSPQERAFLDDPHPDPVYCQRLVWRLESIWVLLWALGHTRALDWPAGMCNTKEMVPILESHESSPDFISRAALRSKAEILDQQDLILRIHWAIRHTHLSGRPLPANLNWAQPNDWVPANASAAAAVVAQRHYALNWLTTFLGADWDEVDTPT